MNVVFRVDSSTVIGSGHVMRCIRIAELLKKRDVMCNFICKNFVGNLSAIIKEKDFNVIMLPSENPEKEHKIDWEVDSNFTSEILKKMNVDTIIVDHYSLDKKWENKQRQFCKKIMVIDDLDNREHSADILLDQNLFPNMQKRYQNNLNFNCKKFIGLEYAFLDPDFKKERENIKKKEQNTISKIFIYFGNTGDSNILERVLNIFINNSFKDIELIVLFSGDFNELNRIKKLIKNISFIKLLDRQPNLAKIISSADLSIGAGGATTWERVYLGIPSAVITVSESQKICSQYLSNIGLIRLIGHHNDITNKELTNFIKKFILEKDLRFLSEKCLSINIGTKIDEVIEEILV